MLGLITVWAAYSSYLVFKCGVPPVPTNKHISRAMIKAARLSEDQQIFDLGCGFGDVLLQASLQYPKNSYQGFDINRPVVWVARWRARNTKIKFTAEDFFSKNLNQADIIFCYLWPSIMQQIEKEIWSTLKPGTRLISHAFPLPNVSAQEIIPVKKGRVFVYVKD